MKTEIFSAEAEICHEKKVYNKNQNVSNSLENLFFYYLFSLFMGAGYCTDFSLKKKLS